MKKKTRIPVTFRKTQTTYTFASRKTELKNDNWEGEKAHQNTPNQNALLSDEPKQQSNVRPKESVQKKWTRLQVREKKR